MEFRVHRRCCRGMNRFRRDWSRWLLCRIHRILLSLSPRHEELLHSFERCGEFVLLDGSGWVHMLWTDLGALAYERASPDPLRMREYRHAFGGALVARIFVIAMGERQGCWADKDRIKSRNGTGRITKQAIDAHAVLAELFELIRSLEILTCCVAILVDEPGLHFLQLL